MHKSKVTAQRASNNDCDDVTNDKSYGFLIPNNQLTTDGEVLTKVPDYQYTTVSAHAEFTKENEKDGLYDLVFKGDAKDVF